MLIAILLWSINLTKWEANMSQINFNLAASQMKGDFLKIKKGKNSTHIWFL